MAILAFGNEKWERRGRLKWDSHCWPDDRERDGHARPETFAWNLDEVSGSRGDLDTCWPQIIGAITVVMMGPTCIFVTFNLFYALACGSYGIPVAVQPMKVASAAVLISWRVRAIHNRTGS